MDTDERALMQLQIDCLSRALLNMSSDLVRAGMSGYDPLHSELISVGSWGLGLLTGGLGYKLEEIKTWD